MFDTNVKSVFLDKSKSAFFLNNYVCFLSHSFRHAVTRLCELCLCCLFFSIKNVDAIFAINSAR